MKKSKPITIWLPKRFTKPYTDAIRNGGWKWLREEPDECMKKYFRKFTETPEEDK